MIKLHEKVYKTGALLSETDWAVLRLLLKPDIEPFVKSQRLLEGEECVTVSLPVHYISDLGDGLNHALNYAKLPAPVDDPVEIAAKKAVIRCVEMFAKDFDEPLRG